MIYKDIIKKIQHDSWWSESAPGNYQQVLWAWRGFILQGNIYGPKFLSIAVILYKDNFMYEKTSEQEKLAQFYLVLKQFTSDKKKILDTYHTFLTVRSELMKIGEESMLSISKASDSEFIKQYKRMYDAYTRFGTYATMPESVDIYSDQKLVDDILKNTQKSITRKQAMDAALILSTYPMRSFIEDERHEFLKIVLSKNKNFEAFSEKYHWIENNYFSPRKLTCEYFQNIAAETVKKQSVKDIQEEILRLENKEEELKKEQRLLLDKLKLGVDMEKTLEFIRLSSRWIDERKYAILHAIEYIDNFMHKIADRKGLKKELVGYYTPEEIVLLFQEGKSIPEDELISRRRFSVYVTTREEEGYMEYIFTARKAREIFSLFGVKNRKEEMRGFVACAPVTKVKGEVQIILNPHRDHFSEGKILVTTMTRPDFVPLMRKAKAIITDEGGITCHAAILSRELDIPCIIGTKVATKVLKNGDRIEIDTNAGLVRIVRDHMAKKKM